MSDTLSKLRRSEVMSSIKSINTKPEIIVRKFLFQSGLRYRLHDKNLPARPDIKLTKYKCLVFVNGCFWHGHKNCRIYVMPKTNKKFWGGKIQANIIRDRKKINKLRRLGWKVLVVWECDLKPKKREKTLNKLLAKILSF